jgi:hypothetical protein
MELNGRIRFCPSLAELEQLLQQHRGQLDTHHATAALSRALKLCSKRQDGPGRAQGDGSTAETGAALALAAELFDELLGRMDGRGLSNAFHGMVKAGHEPANGLRGRVLAALLANDGQLLHEDRAHGTSNVLWALATLHRKQGERFEEASIAALVGVARVKLQAASTNPPDLANTAWALAVLGHEDRAFMGELLAAALVQLPAFKPQALSDTLWAAATLGLPLPPSFQGTFLAVAEAKLRAFKPQHLSHTLWAAATLGLPLPPSFQGAFLAAAEAQLPAFAPQALRNTLWAAATLGLQLPPAFLAASTPPRPGAAGQERGPGTGA